MTAPAVRPWWVWVVVGFVLGAWGHALGMGRGLGGCQCSVNHPNAVVQEFSESERMTKSPESGGGDRP